MLVNLNFVFLVVIASITVGILIGLPIDAYASESITIIPINNEISMQKTTTIMTIPDDNKLSWGAVKGKASDYAERYPVIIQFFKEGEPIHVAQINVKGDGSYEYKFKIRTTDVNTGKEIDVFKGQYFVKIFKVINNQDKVL
ncbi:MAG: hypothetical protein KC483_06220 [Nitrosarchaeum sp.]|nr:hypothetical protein [Nitrosarchaeum sp.]